MRWIIRKFYRVRSTKRTGAAAVVACCDFSQLSTTTPFVHEYWEEVFLVSGDLTVGKDDCGHGGTTYVPFTYACRPPGAMHGPFKSERGCILFEIHYFDPD